MSSVDGSLARLREASVPPAVVIGLDSITGLQSARILRDRGVPVVGVVADRSHWGARTNACVSVVESPLRGEALVRSLAALGHRIGRPSVLIPCTDGSVDTVSRHRDELLPQLLLSLAPHSVVERLMDKERFAAYAESVGLPVPRTEVLGSREDVEAVAAEVTYPCVVKPSGKSVSWLAHTSAKGFTVHDPGHLLSVYDTVAGWSDVILLQEWVAGPESGLLSCNGFFGRGGEPLVTFMARKIRQWPPEIGTSASGEECRDDEALETAVSLFRNAGFQGLAYLEMKRDVRTGRLMLIEPNVGRPTGRSAVAEAGGVELLHTAYCHAAGLPLPARREQHYGGAKWLDLRRDLQAVAVARRRSTLTFADWRRWARGPKAHAIWAPRDPAPFCVDLVHATSTGVRRALRPRGAPVPTAETAARPASVPAPRTEERTRL